MDRCPLGGGADRDRTDDLYNAIVALFQLSYGPKVPIKGRLEMDWRSSSTFNLGKKIRRSGLTRAGRGPRVELNILEGASVFFRALFALFL
jgi:hypothetical protein